MRSRISPSALRAAPPTIRLQNPTRFRRPLKKAPCSALWISRSSALPDTSGTLWIWRRRKHPVQASVREGGGNNGAIVNTALDGVPTIVIGVPVRYIHTVYGIASIYDFEATVRLAVELVKSMTAEQIKKF